MIWGSFAATWNWTACHYGRENVFPIYQGIHHDNVRVAVCKVKVSRSWMMETITLNIKVNLLENDYRDTRSAWSWPLRDQTSSQ